MSKPKIASIIIALHIIILITANYLRIGTSMDAGLGTIISMVSQRTVPGSAVFLVMVFFLLAQANVAWWATIIYSFLYLLIAIPASILYSITLAESGSLIAPFLFTSFHIALIFIALLLLITKESRALCNKSLHAAMSEFSNA
jgi:hypothetical protein